MYKPSTEVRIGTVPFNPNHKHVRWYANATEQANEMAKFMDPTKITSSYTYQRLTRAIDVEFNAEEMYNYNYAMFQNENFGNKWFYAFITRAEYVNANTTRLYLDLDWTQTYMFDIHIPPCFVEREHVNDDTLGKWIRDEGFSIGEPVCTFAENIYDANEMYIVVASAVEPLPDGTYVNVSGDAYQNVVSGTSLTAFLYPGQVDTFKRFMDALSNNGQQDAVSAVYMCPIQAVPGVTPKENGYGNWIDASKPRKSTKYSVDLKLGALDGYTPKNNKMLCYPYEYAEVLNFMGQSSQMMVERMKTRGLVELDVTGGPDVNSGLMAIPQNYNGLTYAPDMTVNFPPFPTCNWVYQTTENITGRSSFTLPGTDIELNSTGQLPMINSFANMVSSALGSAATGNIGGVLAAGVSGISDMTNTYAAFEQTMKSPNTARGGTNSAVTIRQVGLYGISVRKWTAKHEIAKQIDDFFTQYGYKVDMVKQPNLTGRRSWNYVKTVGANITGKVPANYLQAFNSLLDSGVTFWHTNDMGNYSLDNSII